MQNFFDLVARGGTAPTASSSSNMQQPPLNKKYQKQQLDDVPTGWRPKTISGGGDANDLSDFNTSLRQNKVIPSSLDSRGDVEDTSSHEYTADLDGDEYIKAMESFQAAVDSWSFQKDLAAGGPQPPSSPPPDRSSGGATGVGATTATRRPESRSRATKDSKKLASNGMLSAYTQNVPNIVLQSQQQSLASKKRDSSATTSRSAAASSAAGSGGNSNSSNASPRPSSRDKDAKFVNSSSIYINEIKAVYGSIDFISRPSAPAQSLLSKPKMFPPKASSANANSGGGRPFALKSPMVKQGDNTSALNSPAPRIAILELDGEASYPMDAVGREAATSPKTKQRKKMKAPSLLKSSLEPRQVASGSSSGGGIALAPAATVAVARNDGSRVDEQALTDSDERSSPNDGTASIGGQRGDYCDAPPDVEYASNVITSESSTAAEADSNSNFPTSKVQLNLNKRKDKLDAKRDANLNNKSPSINKRGMLARSPSGLQLIMEDKDELAEQVDATPSNFDDIVLTTISTPLPVDMKIRPQSRKLYLGTEGISSYGIHSSSGGTPVIMPTTPSFAGNTSEVAKVMPPLAQLQPAADIAPPSARPRYGPPTTQRHDDDADLGASESRTRLATLPASQPVSAEKPTLKKMHSFNQAIKPNPWQEDDLSQVVRPPSRQRSAFPVHLVDVPPQNSATNGSGALDSTGSQAPLSSHGVEFLGEGSSTRRSTSDHLLPTTTKSPRIYQADFEVDTSVAAGVVVATNPIKVSSEGMGLRASASRRSLPDQPLDDEASVASSNSKANKNRPPSRQKIAAQNLFEGFEVNTARDAPDKGSRRSDGPLSISNYDIGAGAFINNKHSRAEKEVSSAPLYSRSVPNTALGAGYEAAGSSSTYQPSGVVPRNRASTTRGVGLGSLHYDPKDDGFSDIDLADAPFFIQINNSDSNDDFIEPKAMLENNYQFSFDKLVRSTADLIIIDEGAGAGSSKGKGPPHHDYDGSRNSSTGGKSGNRLQVQLEADRYTSSNYFFSATKNVHDKSKSVRNTRGLLGGGGGGGGSSIATTAAAPSSSSSSSSGAPAVLAISTRLGMAADGSGHKDGWTEAHHREGRVSAPGRTPQNHSPSHQSENYSNMRFNSYHMDSDVEDDEITIMTEESQNDCIMEASMSLQSFALDSSLGEDFLSLFAPAEN
eukprot:gene32303-41864_t